ncbi:hypothetical protein B566_EDAN013999 [Ephemera danica]|nr:hypothetical protein B566_EDAN013999 [Ephemera danica]
MKDLKVRILKQVSDDSAHAPDAVDTLLHVIRDDKSTTLRGLMDALRKAVSDIYDPSKSPLSVVSACELFNLFITLSGGDLENPVSVHIIVC